MLTCPPALIIDPLDAHFPIKKHITPEIENMEVKTPSLKPPTEVSSYTEDLQDYAVETYEWLSMIQLGSPRIDPKDKIDSFLSRYTPPGDSITNCNLVKVTWRGFLSPSWVHKMFVDLLLAVPREAWFVCSVASFGEGVLENCKDCTILRLPDAPNEYVLWEMA